MLWTWNIEYHLPMISKRGSWIGPGSSLLILTILDLKPINGFSEHHQCEGSQIVVRLTFSRGNEWRMRRTT
jgi:hypothetical protein